MIDPLKMNMAEAFDQFVKMAFDDKLNIAERESAQQIFYSGALHVVRSAVSTITSQKNPAPAIQRLGVLYAELNEWQKKTKLF